MSFALLFWILMLLWLVLGLYWTWPGPPAPGPAWWGPFGGNLLLFLLLLLLGWRVFGSPIHG